MNATQKEQAKLFARKYGMAVEQFNKLSPDHQRLVLVTNEQITLDADELLMLSFILSGHESKEYASAILGMILERDVNPNIIAQQFGVWRAELVNMLNNEAMDDSRRMARTLQAFDLKSFPVTPRELFEFMKLRSVEGDEMSISDRWRAKMYNQILQQATAALNGIDEEISSHNATIAGKAVQ